MQLQNELHRNIHYRASTRGQDNYRRNIRHQRTRKIIVRKTSSPKSELLNRVDALNSSEIKESIKEKYPNLFTGLGKIKYQEYDIKLPQEATPYAIAVPRQVPILLRNETERELLQRMERSGVISRVEDPAEWCALMVVTPKSSGKSSSMRRSHKAQSVCATRKPSPTNKRQDVCKSGWCSLFFRVRNQLGILANQALEKIKTFNNIHNALGKILFQRSSLRNKFSLGKV